MRRWVSSAVEWREKFTAFSSQSDSLSRKNSMELSQLLQVNERHPLFPSEAVEMTHTLESRLRESEKEKTWNTACLSDVFTILSLIFHTIIYVLNVCPIFLTSRGSQRQVIFKRFINIIKTQHKIHNYTHFRIKIRA